MPAAARGASARAFALLEHTTTDGVHWDLLIEVPDRPDLATWRLAASPLATSAATIPATALPPHRRIYLEYEGPISGDRGHVRRIAGGTLRAMTDLSADGGTFEVATPAWRGTYRIDREALTRTDPADYDAGLPNRTED